MRLERILTSAVSSPGWIEPDTLHRMLIFSRHFALFLTIYSTSCAYIAAIFIQDQRYRHL